MKTATATGDRTDRAATDAQLLGHLSLGEIAFLEQAVDFTDEF